MIIGRAEDRAVVDGILERATGGASGALVVRGDPGVGKTTLLDYAQEQAPGLCLRVRAVPEESDFLYAGLHELVQPVLHALDDIPEVQAVALKGALALGDPVSMGRLSVGAATLSLLSVAATARPVVCLIDDAQWLDPASADALTFAARRLQADGLVMIFAAEQGTARPFVAGGLPELRMRGLTTAEAVELLAARGKPLLARSALDTLVTLTGGNAWAILEVSERLSPAERSGEAPLPHPLPVGPELTRAFTESMESLSPTARDSLLVVAASATQNVRVILSAGEPSMSQGLDEAEEAGIVRVEQGRVTFVHPLAASIVYHGATPAQQRKAHRAVVQAFAADGAYRERRAWNMAAAEVVPNEVVATELAAVADLARERRGHAAAAGLYEAAARLTPNADQRLARTYAAARSAWLAGQPDRLGVLLKQLPDEGAGLAGVPDPVLRADISLLRGRIAVGQGDLDTARLVVDTVDAVALIDPTRAGRMLVLASQASSGTQALGHAERAAGLGEFSDPTTRLLVRLALSRAFVGLGRRAEALAPLQESLDLLSAGELLAADPESLADAVWLLAASAVAPTSSLIALLAGVADLAQRHAVVALPAARLLQADLDVRRGRWAEAEVAYFEARQLAAQTGQRRTAGSATAGAAVLAAHRGRTEECGQLLVTLDTNPSWPRADRAAAREIVVGLLALGEGRPAEAGKLLSAVDLSSAADLLPRDAVGGVDVVDALVRGDRAAARGAFERLDFEPGSLLHRWGAALLADTDYEPGLRTVIDTLSDANDPRPFAVSRAQLALGERLRRDGRRTDARVALSAAHETFEELGALGWAERARNELKATGATARRRATTGVEELTAQELLVARVVADGATYKQAAARLFLSPKTIEFHLSKVYPKLGISSRHELSARLGPSSVEATQ